MDHHIEIVIKKLKTRVRATSPLFPDCKGVGQTEPEAVEKLVRAISRHVARITESSLKSILLSNQYTEVLIEASAQPAERRKIFPTSPSLVQLQHAVLLRMKAKSGVESKTKVEKDIQDLFAEMEDALSKQINSKEIEGVLTQLLDKPDSNAGDGFILGFPLSLN